MPRVTVPPAWSARPGMPVRQQLIGVQDAPDHVIMDAHLNDDMTITITTNVGQWTFDPSESVTFPRRPDGSKRNWFAEGVEPLPKDLCPGDVLPPSELDPLKDEQLSLLPHAQQLHEDWLKSVQIVSSVWRDKRPGIINVTTRITHPYPTGLRWKFAEFQRVTFPHPGCAIVGRTPKELSPTRNRPFRAYGPYVTEEAYVFIAEHPNGVGHWPKELSEGIKLDDDVVIRRLLKTDFPKTQHPDLFRGTNQWQRHPKDPRWGQPAQYEENVTRAVRLYNEYIEKAEKYPGDLQSWRLG